MANDPKWICHNCREKSWENNKPEQTVSWSTYNCQGPERGDDFYVHDWIEYEPYMEEMKYPTKKARKDKR